MNKILSYIFLAGMAIFAISCAEPADPTPTNMSYGDWRVDEYYVNNQSAGDYTYAAFTRFKLERDKSFVLEDENGFVYVGTWTAGDNLTLTADDGTVFDFEIVFQNFNRMQLLQTIENPSAGSLSIRYLLNNVGLDTDY